MKRIVLASMLLSLGPVACGTSVKYMPLNPAPRALSARPAAEVQVFTSQTPSRKYVEVGLITTQKLGGAFATADDMELIESLREEAAKQGCDGLVITGSNKMAAGSGSVVYTASESTLGFRAVCVVFEN